MTELPHGWGTAVLGDLGDEIRVSVTPEPDREYELYSVPAFADHRPEVVVGREIGSAKRAVEPDDVLLCKINPRINRVWIVGAHLDRVQIASPEYLILRTPEPVLSKYLRWYLSSPRFRDWITLSVEGATGSHTRAKSGPIMRQLVPVPPLAEQRRIISAIEEQLSRLDSAEEQLRRVGLSVARLRAALFNSVFGQACHDVELHEVADIVSGQTPKGLVPLLTGPIPYYKVGDMNQAAGDEMRESRTYVDEELVQRHRLHVRPAGTVIFPKRGGAIATDKKRVLALPAAFDLNTMGIIPGEQLLPRYLLAWFKTVGLASIADGSNVPQINHDDVAYLRIPMVPLEEQERTVALLETQLSRLAAIEEASVVSQSRARGLRAAILASAFRGELVLQHTDDEPASVLLERIAAERATAPKPVRRRATMAER